MFTYTRDVFYYETDKMGVVHHSNITRWFEEGRIAFLQHIGLPFEQIEENGVLSPVIGLQIKFRHFARFGDRFTVSLWLSKYTGIVFNVGYRICNQAGELLFEGETEHVFTSVKTGRVVSLTKAYPQGHEKLKAAYNAQRATEDAHK